MQLARSALSIVFAFFVLVGLARVVSAGQPTAPASADAGAPKTETDAGAAAPAAAEAEVSKSNLTVRANTEVAGYIDSTATSVLTPSVGASIENPAAGWSLSGAIPARRRVRRVAGHRLDRLAELQGGPERGQHRGPLQAGALRHRRERRHVVHERLPRVQRRRAAHAGGRRQEPLTRRGLQLRPRHDRANRHAVLGLLAHPAVPLHLDRRLAHRQLWPRARPLRRHGDRARRPIEAVSLRPDLLARVRGDGARAAPTRTRSPAARIQARPLEQLPTERNRYALTGRLAWRGSSTTLRLEERGYIDTWGEAASTTDARFFIDVTSRITLWPHARFNLQNGVNFWRRTYVANDIHDLPALRTGDRELGPLRTLGGGGGLRWALGKVGSPG